MRQTIQPIARQFDLVEDGMTKIVVTLVATLALALAVGALAFNNGTSEESSGSSSATPSLTVRYDGGPVEGAAVRSIGAPAVTRYDGGPEEGTAAQSLGR